VNDNLVACIKEDPDIPIFYFFLISLTEEKEIFSMQINHCALSIMKISDTELIINTCASIIKFDYINKESIESKNFQVIRNVFLKNTDTIIVLFLRKIKTFYLHEFELIEEYFIGENNYEQLIKITDECLACLKIVNKEIYITLNSIKDFTLIQQIHIDRLNTYVFYLFDCNSSIFIVYDKSNMIIIDKYEFQIIDRLSFNTYKLWELMMLDNNMIFYSNNNCMIIKLNLKTKTNTVILGSIPKIKQFNKLNDKVILLHF
jgi:hypothetical protein